MKFGKLSDISNVNFSLPADAAANGPFLKSLAKREDLATVYIGCTGWSMKEWVGKVYPPNTPTKEFLWYYSRQFNTIELNTTHYRIPDAATIEKWYAESAPDFHFCPKVFQQISHNANLGFGSELIPAFCRAVAGLKEKLGTCFLQLPPYFGSDRLAVLQNFIDRWPREIPLAIEFRHESWFLDTPEAAKGFELLRASQMAAVISDVAGRRDVLHQQITEDFSLIRFVGNDLHDTDYQRIDAWVERLKNWVQAGVQDIYFFCHEPDNILAPDLSLYLADQIQKELTARSRGPIFHEEKGGQMSLF